MSEMLQELTLHHNRDFSGLDKALRDGLTLTAFSPGSGIRVVDLKDSHQERKGYGQHAVLSGALEMASHNYLTGEEPLTTFEVNRGFTEPGCLDKKLAQGSKIIGTMEAGLVKLQTFIGFKIPFIYVIQPSFIEAYTVLDAVRFPQEMGRYINSIISSEVRRR